ncbi:MAG: hypothetical protein ABSC37_22000 [Xanthobacteraceae bacterium]|jgi:uncharacterized membrane protein
MFKLDEMRRSFEKEADQSRKDEIISEQMRMDRRAKIIAMIAATAATIAAIAAIWSAWKSH